MPKHTNTLVGRKDAAYFFMCTEGARHRVVGDGRNVQGWEELKEALRDEGPGKEQRELMQWFEQASNFDPIG